MVTDKSKIESLQQYGINFLYDLELPQNNLFFVSQFKDSDAKDDGTSNKNLSPYFRIKSANFNFPKLKFAFHPVLRMNILQDVELNDISQVDVTWIDDVYKSVFMYHHKWRERWYNAEYDYLPVGVEGKFKDMSIILFHYIDTVDDTASLLNGGSPKAEWLYEIQLKGLAPQTFGETSFKLDAGQSQSVTGVAAKYCVNSIKINFNKSILDTGTFYMPIDEYDDNLKDQNQQLENYKAVYESLESFRIL